MEPALLIYCVYIIQQIGFFCRRRWQDIPVKAKPCKKEEPPKIAIRESQREPLYNDSSSSVRALFFLLTFLATHRCNANGL